jgi:hypothetical protein
MKWWTMALDSFVVRITEADNGQLLNVGNSLRQDVLLKNKSRRTPFLCLDCIVQS